MTKSRTCGAVIAVLALAACNKLQVTNYTTGKDGSFNIMAGRHAIALANFSQREEGVALIIFATEMAAGTHAVHIHTSCRSGQDPIPQGRLPNIEVDGSGVGKLETFISGAVLADLIGTTLVIHRSKDYHFSKPEMAVEGVLGCGRFDSQSKIVAGLR